MSTLIPAISAFWNRLPVPPQHAVPMLAGLVVQRATTRARLRAAAAPWGWPALAGGVVLNAWAVAARGGGDLEHPDQLVTSGPYALTRHPMYDGWMLPHVGLGLVARSPWVLASVPTVLLVRGREIRREEYGFAAQFGGDWTAYVGRVPGSLLGRVDRRLAPFRQFMSSSSLRSARPPEPPSSEQGRLGTSGERS